jgi:DNA-binding response OmpR family regulator
VPTLDVIVFTYDLSPFQARILEAVWRGRGLPVQAERIFDLMYADDADGGPEPPKMYAAFKEALHRLRAKLEGSGIAVVNSGYRRGYRLVMGSARKEK